MKKYIILSLFALATSSHSSLAIEIPSPEEAEPLKRENVENRMKELGRAEPKNELKKVAWLGVLGDPIPRALGKHLQLKEGLVLGVVVEGSPADLGGLEKDDIMTHFGGREVASQRDLKMAIQARKSGDEVEASIVHRGQKVKRKLILGEVVKNQIRLFGDIRGAGAPKLNFGRNQNEENWQLLNKFGKFKDPFLKDQMADNLGQLDRNFRIDPKNFFLRDIDFKKFFDNNKEGRNRADFSKMTMSDDKGVITLQKDQNGKKLIVKDSNGKLVFEGPMNNENDKLLIPEEILKRVESFQKSHENRIFKIK